MIGQLEGWGMVGQINYPKPSIDSLTLDKVFTDNGYYAVTLKKEMILKQNQLQMREKEF